MTGRPRRWLVKKVFDLSIVIVSSPLWLPLFAIVALCVRLGIGKPVIFRQRRPGFAERPFVLMKFRTMTDARHADGHLLPDGVRLTRAGRWLRASSLDELPELFNVLRGEMSLVGPRPLLMEYVQRYSPEQRLRHDALPGITGWAQVNGRNSLPWTQRFQLDVWYVANSSIWLDVKILCMTVVKSIRSQGISQPGQATQEEFMGDHHVS